MTLVLLLVGGGVMAGWIVLRGIGASSCGLAQAIIEHRRHEEHVQLQAIAAAEAAGRAASLEPLALNADGTIAAPVLGLVENR